MTARAVLASPLGLAIGLALGALGGGGSVLAVPVLVFLAGQTPAAATTTSLVVVGVAAAVGAFGHWRCGRVRVRAGLAFGLVGIAGSLAGSAANRRLDGDVLLLAFAGLVVFAAWRIVVGCPSCTRVDDLIRAHEGEAGRAGASVQVRTRLDAARAVRIAVVGSAVGFLTGLFGVGGGFMIVPALTLVLGFSMPLAIGTSLVVIAVNTAVALAARAAAGPLDWDVTLLFTAAAVAGVSLGKRAADRLPARAMQRGFAVLLVLVALYTGARAGAALG